MRSRPCCYIDSPQVMPGWVCCACRKEAGQDGSVEPVFYNAIERRTCKFCQHERCSPLGPDPITDRTYGNRKHHRDHGAPS